MNTRENVFSLCVISHKSEVFCDISIQFGIAIPLLGSWKGFMLEMLMQWYRRRFSDPEAIALLIILVAGFGILFF